MFGRARSFDGDQSPRKSGDKSPHSKTRRHKRFAPAARNGQEARALLAEAKPDVVTLDIEMPVMDGLATLRELRKLRPELPVIMFSSLTQRGAQATLHVDAAYDVRHLERSSFYQIASPRGTAARGK